MIKQSHNIATPDRQHSAHASLHVAPSESSSVSSGSLSEQATDPTERAAENTILVANDEPELLELMCRLLRVSGYHVIAAVDGQDGFEVAQAQHPRLIISDVAMPRMDGIELCRLVRAHPELSLTPVLLVSAHRKDNESVLAGLQAGADDFLEAPYEPMHLIAKVARLLEHRQMEEMLHKRAELLLANDVTERERTERAVKFQAHLLATVEQAVIATDLAGRIIYWNKFAEQLYGWTAAEAVGRQLLELTPAETTREHAAEIMAHLWEGQSWSGEFLVRRKDGTSFPAMVTDSPIYDDAGQLVGVVDVSFDITQRKRAEEKLKQSESQLAEAQQLAHVGSWSWDIKSNIVVWSDELYRIFGLQPQSVPASLETYLARVHPEDRDFINGVIEHSVKSRSLFSYFYRIIQPDGEVRILHSYVSAVQGKVHGVGGRLFFRQNDRLR